MSYTVPMLFSSKPFFSPEKRVLCLVVASLLFVSCGARSGERRNANADNSNKPAAIAITVAKAEGRDVAAAIEATGSLVGDETTNVAPKIAGKVSNVYANAGDFVANGVLLAKLDDSAERDQLVAAKAAVRQAQAGVRQAEAKIGLGPNGRFDA